jgi:hypothetical protein
MWLKILGVVYLIVAALGFLMASPILGLIEVNGADNVFHVLLGIVLLGGGFLGKGGAAPSMGSGMNTPPMGGAGPAGQPPQQM